MSLAMDLRNHGDEEVFRLAANCIVEIMTDGPRCTLASDRLATALREIERRFWGRDGVGMLHTLGYHVGRTDPVPRDRRQAILRYAFERVLPRIKGLAYVAGWGEPTSSQRQARLLNQLQWFYDQNVWKPEMNRACIEWKADIDFVAGFVVGASLQAPVTEIATDVLD